MSFESTFENPVTKWNTGDLRYEWKTNQNSETISPNEIFSEKIRFVGFFFNQLLI